ncbi:MAG: secondary thiamine-phosphate synthase enzyme YjbQ, partial [Phycisphaerales bacterium]|nr:secondary thiamine-phosphate synthase enzyme YjbQ [Phycisphaerales bacterium]
FAPPPPAVAPSGQFFNSLLVGSLPLASVAAGVCTLSIMHTSASLIVFENADPTAKRDIEAWMRRHVPDGDPSYTHDDEGPDDMPSHIRAALTATTLSIPVHRGELMLGRWQGVYLWEHRTAPHRRSVAVAVVGGSGRGAK